MGGCLRFRVFSLSLALLAGASSAVLAAEVELGQVVVTATKTEMDLSEVPQSMSVITREEIMNTPDRTLPEIIQRTTGVQVNQNGPVGSISSVQIRGSQPEQVLVMIDGRRINEAQSGMFDLSNLPLNKDDIERIEILRGGASALYGADAMGGVINIITKAPSAKPYTRVSASYGRFDTQDYSLTHRWKPGPLGYGLSVGRQKSDGYRPNSDLDSWILDGDLSYDLGASSQLSVSARNIRKEIGVPGPVFLTDPDDREKDNLTQLDLVFRGKYSPYLDLTVRGFQNVYRRFFETGDQGVNLGTDFLHKNYATGGEVQASSTIGAAHLLTGGVEAIQDRVNSTAAGIHEATRGALYLQDEIEVAKPVTATLGLRYDHHSIYDDQLNPRAAVLLRLPWEVRLRASVARSYRAPTFDDLFWPEDAFVSGNPNLQPEKAWSYEVGVEKKFGEWALVKLAGFYRDVDDLIRWAIAPDGKWRPTNVQSAEIWGAEAELVFYLAKGLSIPLNYSYLYPRDLATGNPISEKAKHIFNAGIEYSTGRGFKASLMGRYVQFYRGQTSTLNPDYFVADARVAYDWRMYKDLEGEAFLSLTNAFNREYQTKEGFPMPPRSLNGGVSLAF
jgi:outer membrane cobalamin receptor